MRRHLALLDFFTRAASSYRQWLPTGMPREQHAQAAMQLWYAQP
jgi:hypothetical protein